MTFERAEEFTPDVEWTIDDGQIHIHDESVQNAIKSVYTFTEGIPITDVEEVINRLNHKLMEMEDTQHHDFYNELRDARTILMDEDIPRVVEGFEHVVEEYETQVAEKDYLTMRGLRGSIIEQLATIEEPSEDDVREEAEAYIAAMSDFSEQI